MAGEDALIRIQLEADDATPSDDAERIGRRRPIPAEYREPIQPPAGQQATSQQGFRRREEFDPYEAAQRKREGEMRAEQVKLAYDELYDAGRKTTGAMDTILEGLKRTHGILPGAFGGLAASALELTSILHKARVPEPEVPMALVAEAAPSPVAPTPVATPREQSERFQMEESRNRMREEAGLPALPTAASQIDQELGEMMAEEFRQMQEMTHQEAVQQAFQPTAEDIARSRRPPEETAVPVAQAAPDYAFPEGLEREYREVMGFPSKGRYARKAVEPPAPPTIEILPGEMAETRAGMPGGPEGPPTPAGMLGGPEGPPRPNYIPPTATPADNAAAPDTDSSLAALGEGGGLAGGIIATAVILQQKANEFAQAMGTQTRQMANDVGNFGVLLATKASSYDDAIGAFGDHMAKAFETLDKTIPGLGQLISIIPESVSRFGQLDKAIASTAAHFAEFSGGTAQAQAMAEVGTVLGDIRRAQQLEPDMVRYIGARFEIQQRYEDIKMNFLQKILPIVSSILEGLSSGLDNLEQTVTILRRFLPPGNPLLDSILATLEELLAASQAQQDDPSRAILQNAIIRPGTEGA